MESTEKSTRPSLLRLGSAAGVYAAAAVAQQAVGFLFMPAYTRLIPPNQYGMLEVLNAFASIAFAGLSIGFASAISKCYHRDCRSQGDKESVLATALVLDLPILVGGALLLIAIAGPASRILVGTAEAGHLIRVLALSLVAYGVVALSLAALRAQERAFAFGVLTVIQVVACILLNLALVVGLGWGVDGVLWSNVISNTILLPVAFVMLRSGNVPAFNRRLVRPLVQFGALVVPVMLAAWVMDTSDRYILRLYRGLDDVAVYGVGYKFGMVLQVAVVWPFQLAWPAFSFAISNEGNHRETYARALTYLSAVLVAVTIVVSLGARALVPWIVGTQYAAASAVVPVIALAYALNGVQFCLAPGIHLAGKTQRLTFIAVLAAGVNLVTSLVLIRTWGMMGAAWSTVVAFGFLAASTAVVAQRVYPVRYEYGRLGKVLGAGLLAYFVAIFFEPSTLPLSIAWYAAVVFVGFPLALVVTGFFEKSEVNGLVDAFRKAVAPRVLRMG